METVVLKFVSVCRMIFYNTPIAKLPLTAKIYSILMDSAFKKQDRQFVFRELEIIAPTKDITIVPGLLNGYYEKLELDIFSRIAEHDTKSFVDVGANLGLYSLIASKKGVKKITAFEPVPENLGYIDKNLDLNDARKTITVISSAVGSEPGTLTLHISDRQIGTHSAVKSENDHRTSSIEVPVTTLDTHFSGRRAPIDLLKVDVEGYESAVFEGAQKVIAKMKPTVFTEFLPELFEHKSKNEFNSLYQNLIKHYRWIFTVNEISGQVIEIKKSSLKDGVDGCNLILTNRASHANIIRLFIRS